MQKTDRIVEVLDRLRCRYPRGGALEVGTAYHMLVLVMLSARTRDEQVLLLAPRLFTKYPRVEDLAQGDVGEIAQAIGTIGLFRQKAKHLKALALEIVTRFHGEVPSTMEELTSLPGVGRKTASVVLVAAFNKPAIAVDTHVQRVVHRLGWVTTTLAAKTERVLLKLVPERYQPIVNKVFVPFGRSICLPRAPRCWACPLVDVCAYGKKNLTPPKNAEEIVRSIDDRQRALAELTDRTAKLLS